jgi:hypothetical protein
MVKNIIQKLKTIFSHIKIKNTKISYEPLYRLVEIREDDGEYTVVIQVINKGAIFIAKPEEILANDTLVDQFSPKDVRSLTYLGYLGVNSPKYKILAQRLSQSDKTIFVLKKKGEKKVILKTADQIMQETDVILSMHSQDAKIVGYTVAAEAVVEEKKQKQALLKTNYSEEKLQLENSISNKEEKK